MNDMVNSPDHYTAGLIECIDIIRAELSQEQYMGYLWGNIQKYLYRWPHKDGIEDLRKAEWYLDRLIMEAEKIEKENENE